MFSLSAPPLLAGLFHVTCAKTAALLRGSYASCELPRQQPTLCPRWRGPFMRGGMTPNGPGLAFCKFQLKRPIMPTGVVKWFKPTIGYGFIQPDEGGNDVNRNLTP